MVVRSVSRTWRRFRRSRSEQDLARAGLTELVDQELDTESKSPQYIDD